MTELAPPEATRNRIGTAVGLSVLFPGSGHLLAGRAAWAAFWCVLCQGLLFGGGALAGFSQLDYGTWFQLGGTRVLFLLVPELGNFLGTQLAALLFHSVEQGGTTPALLPWRSLGYLMSGASGVLSCYAAAHAAGLVLAQREPVPERRINPGTAALATVVLPGAGHWLSGRRFKAALLGGIVLGLFFLGMALGGFADFDRQRHPYYWAGEMLNGWVGWITAWSCDARRFRAVLPYQDVGLLFITSSGLFTVIAALDAYHRALEDWLRAARAGAERPGGPEGQAGAREAST